MPDIRLVLVDDEWLVRAGLRTMLAGESDIEIVGEAGDGSGIAELVTTTGANIVLMDVRMPGVDGLTATAVLRGLPDPPDVIMLTTFNTDDLVLRALHAGATGFLLKDTPPADLISALRTVVAGESILSPAVTSRLIAHVTEPDSRSAKASAELYSLTAAERRVAEEVARGASNAEIARTLFISVATVKSHISHTLEKLGFNNRVQIALMVHDATAEQTR